MCLVFHTFFGLLVNRLYFTADKPLAVGFLDPPRDAHLGSIGEDHVAPVVRAFRVVALVVGEQGEGVGLGCVGHWFWFEFGWVGLSKSSYLR